MKRKTVVRAGVGVLVGVLIIAWINREEIVALDLFTNERIFDAAALEELDKAFSANPTAARDKYRSTRWTIRAEVAEIHDGSLLLSVQLDDPSIALPQASVGIALATCRNVTRNREYLFEARILSLKPFVLIRVKLIGEAATK